jgi:hypothetical protein
MRCETPLSNKRMQPTNASGLTSVRGKPPMAVQWNVGWYKASKSLAADAQVVGPSKDSSVCPRRAPPVFVPAIFFACLLSVIGCTSLGELQTTDGDVGYDARNAKVGGPMALTKEDIERSASSSNRRLRQ